VTALGSPEKAADRLLKQTFDEFMSTRLGSRKEAEILSASRRDVDGRVFYDIEVIPAARPSLAHTASHSFGHEVALCRSHYLVADKPVFLSLPCIAHMHMQPLASATVAQFRAVL